MNQTATENFTTSDWTFTRQYVSPDRDVLVYRVQHRTLLMVDVKADYSELVFSAPGEPYPPVHCRVNCGTREAGLNLALTIATQLEDVRPEDRFSTAKLIASGANFSGAQWSRAEAQ